MSAAYTEERVRYIGCMENARMSISDVESLRNTMIDEALEDAIKLAIRLGDFVGNGEDHPPHGIGPYDRCDMVRFMRQALALQRAAVYGTMACYWATFGIEWARTLSGFQELPEDKAYAAAVSAVQQAHIFQELG